MDTVADWRGYKEESFNQKTKQQKSPNPNNRTSALNNDQGFIELEDYNKRANF